jgi:hypothetical protein
MAGAVTSRARDADGMAVIETMTFRLRDGVDEAVFLAADQRLQTDFAYQQPGLLRRTTAKGVRERDGDWIVVDLWQHDTEADACAERWASDELAQTFMSFVDQSTVDVRRYHDFG